MDCPNKAVMRDVLLDERNRPELNELRDHIDKCTKCETVIAELITLEPDHLIESSALIHQNDKNNHVTSRYLRRMRFEESKVTSQMLLLFPDPPMDKSVLGIVGRYEVVRLISSGGMGLVFEAFDTKLKRKVAIKFIKPYLVSSSMLKRFETEGLALAKVEHPYIAQIFDFGTESKTGTPFIAQEFIDGVRITEFAEHGQFSLRQILELFMKVCQGISKAHEMGVIHRDIKPSNILVTLGDEPVPKIIDFGLAKFLSKNESGNSDRTLTSANELLGTWQYMSPEQAVNKVEALNERTDVYSLGVVLYELTTGRLPIDDDLESTNNSDEIRELILNSQPKKPSVLLSEEIRNEPETSRKLHQPIPVELDSIIMQSIEKNPNQRYQTVSKLMGHIDRFLNDQPVLASSQSIFRFIGKGIRNHSTGLGVAIIVCGVFLLAIYGSSFWRQKELICPILREEDCRLVLSFDSGVRVNLEEIKASVPFLQNLIDSLNRETSFKEGSLKLSSDLDKCKRLSNDSWLCWEMPVVVDYAADAKPSKAGGDADFIPGEEEFILSTSLVPTEMPKNLKIRFAVNADGLFQIATVGMTPQHHLVFLSQFQGIENYKWKDDRNGKLVFANRNEYDTPRDVDLIVGDERHTVMAHWCVELYRHFLRKGLLIDDQGNKIELGQHDVDFDAPQTSTEIYSRPFVLKSYFDSPVSIVQGQCCYFHLRDLDAKAQETDRSIVDEIGMKKNSRFSPLNRQLVARDFVNNRDPPDTGRWIHDEKMDAQNEYAHIRLITGFDFELNQPSILFFRTQSDNRNSSQVVLRNLNSAPYSVIRQGEYLTNKYHKTRVWRAGEKKQDLYARDYSIPTVEGFLLNCQLTAIELEAQVHWSSVSPHFRLVTLGEVDEEKITTSSSRQIFQVKKFDQTRQGLEWNSQLRPTWEGDEDWEDDAPRLKKVESPPNKVDVQVWTIYPTNR